MRREQPVGRRGEEEFGRTTEKLCAPLRVHRSQGDGGQRKGEAVGKEDHGATVIGRRVRVVMQLLVQDRAGGEEPEDKDQPGEAARERASASLKPPGLVNWNQAGLPS